MKAILLRTPSSLEAGNEKAFFRLDELTHLSTIQL
jgi:hypothetical protein